MCDDNNRNRMEELCGLNVDSIRYFYNATVHEFPANSNIVSAVSVYLRTSLIAERYMATEIYGRRKIIVSQR